MKKIFSIVSILIFLSSCSCFKNVPREEIHYVQKDSTILKIVDSVRYIPVERYVDIIPEYDTLKLETSLAQAEAFVDTLTHTLKGKIENKKEAEFKSVEKTEYKVHRDTTYIRVPVEVVKEKKVVPKFFWGTLVYAVLLTLLFAVKIYLKIKAGAIRFPKLR